MNIDYEFCPRCAREGCTCYVRHFVRAYGIGLVILAACFGWMLRMVDVNLCWADRPRERSSAHPYRTAADAPPVLSSYVPITTTHGVWVDSSSSSNFTFTAQSSAGASGNGGNLILLAGPGGTAGSP